MDAAEQADARWEDEKLLGAFWATLYHSIDSAFAAHPGEGGPARAARLAARDTLYRLARIDLVETLGPKLLTVGPRYLERVPLDNAAQLARRVYLTDLPLFDEVYRREGGDLRKAVQRVVELARSRPEDPYGALRGYVGRGF